MLARGALCRLAADMPRTPAHDLPQLARFLQRALLARNASKVPAIRALSRAYASALDSRRSYATTTRATKPTATVKKAVKADAVKKPATKKRASPVKKKTKKRVAAKKTAPKKAAPKRRVKKQLTPEQKEKETLRELRRKALKEPVSSGVLTGFNAFIAEVIGGSSHKGDSREVKHQKFADAAAKWKTLTPAAHEHYNHLANEKTTARQAEFQAWLHSHTPEEIKIANNARARLRKKLGGTLTKKKYPAHTSKLHDDRYVKKALSPFLLFHKERHASGDLKGIKIGDSAKLVGNEWKALSASEKKKYEDEYQATKAQVAREKIAASP